MHKHEGIVVIAYLPGQPASQVAADLELAGFNEFTTELRHVDGHSGMACKVNLHDEAEQLMDELWNEGFCVSTETGHWTLA